MTNTIQTSGSISPNELFLTFRGNDRDFTLRAGPGKRKIPAAALFFFCLLVFIPAGAGAYNKDMGYCVLGIKGGYSYISGYYNDKLEGGPTAGIYFFPYTWKYFLIEIDNTFAYYRIAGTAESALMSFSLGTGLIGFYPLARHISIYGGASVKGYYYYVDAHNTKKEADTFKVGVTASAGFFFPLWHGIQLRLGYSFSENDLSRNVFMAHEVILGAAYGFGTGSKESVIEGINYSEIKDNYDRGIDYYKKGDFAGALKSFKKVYELDREHTDAIRYINSIEKSMKDYEAALENIKNKNYYTAIILLEGVDPNMKEAKLSLLKLRKQLSKEIPVLESLSIRAYEENNFDLCISTLNKLLLIDPENKTARLYLPRAQKGRDTFDKLK